ncbi:MAG: MATE family efflux transporter [Deltaproteobacteria bacterium]|nr:MATE family efflux transporter [Deltaproteobacteria bacterium]
MSPTEKRRFYKTLFQLAVPITIQNTITSSLNLVDTIMIGQLGATEVAAVGLANRLFFIFILVSFAISSGTAVFTAQYWGKKDVAEIGKVMGIALIFNGVIAVLFSIAALIDPAKVMAVFTTDAQVIHQGSLYLAITAFSFLPTAITMLYSFVLRSTGNVTIPMYASTSALVLNTVLNYCMIFGHFGFPALGVKGAAIATLIARFIEMAFIVSVTYLKRLPAVRWRDFLSVPTGLIKTFLITTAPILANEFIWVMGNTTYSIVFGRMGTAEIAAVNIIKPIEEISFSLFFGLASAASVMIGNQIGAGNEDIAHAYAKRFSIIGPVGAVVAGCLIALNAHHVIHLFRVPREVLDFSINMIFILSVVLWIRIFNIISIVGVFRGGGDTRYSLYIEALSVWVVGVPLAFLGGFFWKLPVYWVFALINLEEVFKMIMSLYRLYSKKWIHNLVGGTTPPKAMKYEKGKDSNPI